MGEGINSSALLYGDAISQQLIMSVSVEVCKIYPIPYTAAFVKTPIVLRHLSVFLLFYILKKYFIDAGYSIHALFQFSYKILLLNDKNGFPVSKSASH